MFHNNRHTMAILLHFEISDSVYHAPEGNRPLGRPRRRWVDNIKLDLREIGCDGIDWIDLSQDRNQWRALVKTMMNFRVN
jgi:hypothetical protein